MLKKTYKQRLLVIFLTLTLVPLIFMSLGVSRQFNFIVNQYHENIRSYLEQSNASAEEWFNNKIDILENVGQAFVFYYSNNSIEISEMNSSLKAYRDSSPSFYNIFIVLENGQIYDALDSRTSIDMTQRPWYVNAKERRITIISEPYDDIVTGERVITISMPIYNSSQEFIGVLGGDIALLDVAQIIGKSSLGEHSKQILINSKGKILWESEGNDILGDVDINLFTHVDDKIVAIRNEGANIVAIHSTLPLIGWEIITVTDVNKFYSQINVLKYNYLVFIIICFLIMVTVAFWISKKISKPVMDLRDATREISLGKFRSLKIDPDDEFGEVMGALNEMAITLQCNYEDLQRQTQELMDANQQLQEMNMELEASYEQLEATTEQLDASEQKYRLLIENISDLVWVIDFDGRITFINDVVESMLGYRKDEVLGKSIASIMCSLHDYECDIYELIKKEDVEKKDIWMLAADGQRRVILETSTKRLYQNGYAIGVQGLGRDVTEYVKIKNEIVKRNSELTLLNEMSSSLTSTISTMRTDTLLQNITDKIVQIMGVDICTIRLLDKNNMLQFKTTSGLLSHLVFREAVPILEGDIGEAIIRKNIIEYDDFDERKNVAYYVRDIQAQHKIKHVIYIPLIIEDQAIGAMGIASSEKIDQSNIDILQSLSNNASVAIEKSRLYENSKENYLKTIKALVTAVEVKDTYTQGHSSRVSQYSLLIGRHLGFDEYNLEDLETAGILHDIGKIGIKDNILTKPGKLDPEEYDEIKKHTSIGKKILGPIGLKKEVIEAVLLHHKRYDLKGYPEEIEVEELPIYAKIIGVVDSFDAMISDRSYKEPITIEEALDELRRCSGSQFDPQIVEVMEHIINYHIEDIKTIASA